MGVQQSSPAQDANVLAARTCYYVLLDVQADATEHDIKRAYRKRALELHPDRNFNDVETATNNFAEVQAAYDVLSDPQERAWYDSHRDAILSGHDGHEHGPEPTSFRNVRLTTTEEILSLVSKFNATVPFDDQPGGFFGIAREVFEHLALEEEAAAVAANSDCPGYPTFGFAGDDFNSVVKPFYASWVGFSTKKLFSWKDEYRPSDAPDRRTRRLMEKDNRKSRDDATHEFNHAVGFLVGVPDWAGVGADETHEHFFSDSDEESEIELLECVVCNKSFKSANQLEAHERSKKHTKTVQELRRQLRKEGAELDLDTTPSPEANIDGPSRMASPELMIAPQAFQGESAVLADRRASSSPQWSGSALSYDDEYAPRSVVEQKLASGRRVDGGRVADSPTEGELPARMQEMTIGETGEPCPKAGKVKAKRERRKAMPENSSEGHIGHRCSVCSKSFESRTKLFKHIREEGHASATPTKDEKAMKKKR
ncbi:hypothetical protein G6O67_001265 [Ophiocordyceps sinensis]|uniref:Meiotically up-regulated protein n=1 Tax=Ophiocordyceps sinensis TaxID=72228 RepID=A0A8H4PXJ9_9HYPO|nr:hypothetical protein G6O67_001265 [Ophiocordyceps sinensis]